MDVSPQTISGATFSIVKKGFDPDEVRGFLGQAAEALQREADRAATMEQRARQAAARMQQAEAAAAAAQAGTGRDSGSTARLDDTETISRTLLLAQRTADAHVAEARDQADTMLATARSEAELQVRDAHDQADQVLADARNDARRAADAERVVAEEELQQLLARLEFLRGDVEQLEGHLADQRSRVRAAGENLLALADGQLAEVPAPALSAASDEAVHEEWQHSPVTYGQAAETYDDDEHVDDDNEWSDEPGADAPTMTMSEFGAPEADERAPTPALGFSTGESVLGFRLPDDDTDSMPRIEPAPGYEDDEPTAEVPIITPESGRGTMRIFGDDL
jgi:cell division septum initiation protein DivIVA